MSLAKSVARQVLRWAVPPGVQEKVGPLANRMAVAAQARRARGNISRNAVLKGKHRGERCFILGTGPSINEQDLSPLAKEHCIAVSNFVAHRQFNLIDPAYYCIVPVHAPYTDDDAERWFTDVGNRSKGSTVLLGETEKHLVESRGLFPDNEVFYLSFYRRTEGPSFTFNLNDLTRPLPYPQTVSLMALYAAWYMGFRQIYLLGFDHSWPAHMGQSRHFYREDEKKLGKEDLSNMADHESYFAKFAVLMWRYKVMQHHAERAGVEIYNATPGSLIDAFPFVDYDELTGTSSVVATGSNK